MSSYTPLQKDRQARNRPTHVLNPAQESSSSSRHAQSAPSHRSLSLEAYRDISHETRDAQNSAAHILGSAELLIWHSMARNESLPQTRLHFVRVLAGYESDDDELQWPDDGRSDEEFARLVEEERKRREGKKRASGVGVARRKEGAGGGSTGKRRVEIEIDEEEDDDDDEEEDDDEDE